MNILFVCSRNEWRSRTAETIFKNSQLHNVKSAGTSNTARIKINQSLVEWADTIFVMESKHREIIKKSFSHDQLTNKIIVLDIEDNYKYMDPELVEMLQNETKWYIQM